MFLHGEAVGHAGEEVADGALDSVAFRAPLRAVAHGFRMFEVMMEQGLEHAGGALVGDVDGRVVVEVAVQVLPEREVQATALGAVTNQRPPEFPDIICGGDARRAEVLLRGEDDVLDLGIDDGADGEVAAGFVGEAAVLTPDEVGCLAPDEHVPVEVLLDEQSALEPVIEIMAVVGDLVREICDLGLERG